MNQSNKKKKTQKQLEISKLDEMLWLSTPLGKLMNSINKKTRKVFLSSRPNKYTQRAWVVRIPSSFIAIRSNDNRGYQTVVLAETPDQALDAASISNTWEVLEFSVSDFQVFPNTPL
jgi:hypothetical protein